MLTGVTLVTVVVSEFSELTANMLDKFKLSAKGSVVIATDKSTESTCGDVVLMLGQVIATLLLLALVMMLVGDKPSVSIGLKTISVPKVVFMVVASSTGNGK